ncbi:MULTISPECIES: Imm74 family immunity protein [unclassified Bartonella]|uniref:Imm74 family immunity protein n=1 Tax=unclassified Bartonella TaxID=2645622 RepID=UPI0021C99691|nr:MULTISPECIES: Imm74 family immunity protein [unclassified Bartonella]UXN02478.1 Imm74 family immunity protein [Bartonella sp. HY406]UXN05451.1 Imm74 family immunity protein [Bartonella sp. HY761]
MIIKFNTGYLWVKIGNKTAKIAGELYFPEETKIAFAVQLSSIIKWQPPHANQEITAEDRDLIIEDIKKEFLSKDRYVTFE